MVFINKIIKRYISNKVTIKEEIMSEIFITHIK